MTITHLLIALVPSAAVAAGNWVVLHELAPSAPLTCPSCVGWLVGGPVALGVLLALVLRAPARDIPPVETADAGAGALRLLAVLQEEGRLVDFLEEDLGAYGDEQVGAAARGIHAGCRKALRERVTLEPVLGGAEGAEVVVEEGFDPATIRLTGNVSGTPPFRGVLRHAGWRVRAATLGPRPGHDPHVIAPAEVEIA